MLAAWRGPVALEIEGHAVYWPRNVPHKVWTEDEEMSIIAVAYA